MLKRASMEYIEERKRQFEEHKKRSLDERKEKIRKKLRKNQIEHTIRNK